MDAKQSVPDAALKRKADSLEIIKKAKALAHEMLMQRSQDSTLYVPPGKPGAPLLCRAEITVPARWRSENAR